MTGGDWETSQSQRLSGVVRHLILKVLGTALSSTTSKKGDCYKAERETDQGDSKASARICP